MCEMCDAEMVNAAEVAAERVAAGIAWMDDNAPEDWRSRIDLDRLDINDFYTCVLGQVFDNFDDRMSGYDYAVYTRMNGSHEKAKNLGFSPEIGGLTTRTLTTAWKRALS